jgi:hypothetical protein
MMGKSKRFLQKNLYNDGLEFFGIQNKKFSIDIEKISTIEIYLRRVYE